MKRKTACYCLAACLSLLLGAPGLAARTPDAHESVHFRLVRDYLIVVRVTVNGAGAADFLLDTGTNTTVITPALAAQLNLRPVDRMELTTVAGSVITPRVLLPRLALGPRSADDVEALVADLPELRRLDTRVCGVLGQNFLARFNYLLDYRERRMEFVDAVETRWRGARLPVERDEGRLLLAAQTAQPAPTALRLVLDSAAPGLVLFGSGSRKLGGGLEPGEGWPVHVTTNAGKSIARSCILPRLRLGDESFSRLTVTLLPGRAASQSRAEDGLLPTSLFRAVLFNNKEQYVILNPRGPA